jgi:hypothetical protein
MNRLNLLLRNSVGSEFNDPGNGLGKKAIKLERKYPLGVLTLNAAEIFETQDLLSAELIQDVPDTVVAQLSVVLEQPAQLNHNVQERLLRLGHVVGQIEFPADYVRVKFLKQLQKLELFCSVALYVPQSFLQVLKDNPIDPLLILILVAGSSDHNPIFTEDHAVNLLRVKFRFGKD